MFYYVCFLFCPNELACSVCQCVVPLIRNQNMKSNVFNAIPFTAGVVELTFKKFGLFTWKPKTKYREYTPDHFPILPLRPYYPDIVILNGCQWFMAYWTECSKAVPDCSQTDKFYDTVCQHHVLYFFTPTAFKLWLIGWQICWADVQLLLHFVSYPLTPWMSHNVSLFWHILYFC